MSAPYHHGNLKQALVDAALEILYTEGTAAMTLRAVARRAGVTQAAPYHHFADRDALLAAVAEVGFGRLLQALDRARAASPANPRRAAQDMALAYVRFAIDAPEHYRLMFGPLLGSASTHPALSDSIKQLRERLAGVIVTLQDRGLARRGQPDDLALTMWSLVHGLAMLLIDGQVAGGATSNDRVERLVRDQTALLVEGMVSMSATATPVEGSRAVRKPGIS